MAGADPGAQASRPLLARHWRLATSTVVLVLYLVHAAGVVVESPVIRLDTWVADTHIRWLYPSWRTAVQVGVLFGQRGPATLLFLPYFLWQTWRTRSNRPLVLLGTALLLLNASVGVVKVFVGRLGPHVTSDPHTVFAGGDIYPSGHVANTVVLYGLIALLAVRYRRTATVAAVVLSVVVGLGTVYLNSHWWSDVVGGWFAGALVLLALPTVLPYAQRLTDAIVDRAVAWYRGRRSARLSAERPDGVPAPSSRSPRGAGAGAAPTAASAAPAGRAAGPPHRSG